MLLYIVEWTIKVVAIQSYSHTPYTILGLWLTNRCNITFMIYVHYKHIAQRAIALKHSARIAHCCVLIASPIYSMSQNRKKENKWNGCCCTEDLFCGHHMNAQYLFLGIQTFLSSFHFEFLWLLFFLIQIFFFSSFHFVINISFVVEEQIVVHIEGPKTTLFASY